MSTPAPIIHIDDLSVSYERKRVLSNIYLRLEAGHIYGVLGPNGAGKSTLFKAVLGLVDIAAGEIKVNGLPAETQRREIVYVPQKSEVDWTFPATVYDIVLMGRYPHKSVFSRLNLRDRAKADAALEELGITDLRKRQIGELSGGQQQRVFLARALCQEADIFFLDEPFVGVDATTEEKITSVLRRLANEGKTLSNEVTDLLARLAKENDAMKEEMQAMKKNVQHTMKMGKDELKSEIAHHPIQSVATAFALGFIASLCVRR